MRLRILTKLGRFDIHMKEKKEKEKKQVKYKG